MQRVEAFIVFPRLHQQTKFVFHFYLANQPVCNAKWLFSNDLLGTSHTFPSHASLQAPKPRLTLCVRAVECRWDRSLGEGQRSDTSKVYFDVTQRWARKLLLRKRTGLGSQVEENLAPPFYYTWPSFDDHLLEVKLRQKCEVCRSSFRASRSKNGI